MATDQNNMTGQNGMGNASSGEYGNGFGGAREGKRPRPAGRS